jgi:hypothetical protein
VCSSGVFHDLLSNLVVKVRNWYWESYERSRGIFHLCVKTVHEVLMFWIRIDVSLQGQFVMLSLCKMFSNDISMLVNIM